MFFPCNFELPGACRCSALVAILLSSASRFTEKCFARQTLCFMPWLRQTDHVRLFHMQWFFSQSQNWSSSSFRTWGSFCVFHASEVFCVRTDVQQVRIEFHQARCVEIFHMRFIFWGDIFFVFSACCEVVMFWLAHVFFSSCVDAWKRRN